MGLTWAAGVQAIVQELRGLVHTYSPVIAAAKTHLFSAQQHLTAQLHLQWQQQQREWTSGRSIEQHLYPQAVASTGRAAMGGGRDIMPAEWQVRAPLVQHRATPIALGLNEGPNDEYRTT